MVFPGRGNHRGRGKGGALGGRNACYFFRNTGTCKFGSRCKFSHDSSSNRQIGRHQAPNVEETIEQQQSRADYNAWRRFIRHPPSHNDYSALSLWQGALQILNGDDREWKQMLPRDLDDEDQYYGRQHIQDILDKRIQTIHDHVFLGIFRSFLLVITHTALLDCLSVDTFVGSLYNFISGTNGSRAISCFQHLCEVLASSSLSPESESIDTVIVAMSTALCEILRREQRARFNEELPALINSLENITQIFCQDASISTSQIMQTRIRELHSMIARAGNLLNDETSRPIRPLMNAVKSAYPREIVVPRDRHDNDKLDIAKIKVFPTRDEILSDAQECLPFTDRDMPHFLSEPAERHIDTHFRLLRHEKFGDIKMVLARLMHDIAQDHTILSNPKSSLGDLRVHHYINARISYVSFNRQKGLEVSLSFLQPFQIRRASEKEKRKWWEDSRRLEEGVLLSFIVIHDAEIQHLFFTVTERNTDLGKKNSLIGSGTQATIVATLSMYDQSIVESMMRSSCQNNNGLLIEYSKVVPATFNPILENLQNIQRLSRLPFRQWILPDRIDESNQKVLEIPPPLYARSPTFSFSLKDILKDEHGTLSINSMSSPDDDALVNQIEARTHLDSGQCQGLIAALTREFAFIQGPPGTGKSYLGVQLMRVLLALKRTINLGPIIVVCFTNHALDQFLEHLIGVGVRKIIRIGAQSRSSALEEHNLRDISKTEMKTKSEGYLLATSYKTLDEIQKKIKLGLGRLHRAVKRLDWHNFQRHLSANYPLIHNQFSSIDEDGFHIVGRHPFETWIMSPNPSSGTRPIQIEAQQLLDKATMNVHSLSHVERRNLVTFWTQEIESEAVDELFGNLKMAEAIQRTINNIHDEVDRRVLDGADVIGITTTGLARRIDLLQHVACKIVICEEAGEVLEAHMLSAMLPKVEHFVQIGDHEQLRPSVTNHSLSLEGKQGNLYQLDRSQFERLSVGERGRPKVPVTQLNVQRRMRPEISTLIRETIYRNLTDHISTHDLPDVIGMRKNVFWLDHTNVEDAQQSESHHNKSKSNSWEVEIVHALVRHIVRQGVYNSSDIAVLTPYTKQLQKLRTAMRSDFEIVLSERDQDALAKDGLTVENDERGDEDLLNKSSNRKVQLEKKKLADLLRVATVDNFQGEEAKIIIVSLVRSNEERKVGFLKTRNRINVLLSRAQHGMYLIGNIETYSSTVPMWQQIINILRAKDSVGTSLGLCCPRHPDTEISVQQPEDFARLSPEGGCRLACDQRLRDCGHRCQARCHSNSMHTVFSCPRPCERTHDPCNHPCQKPTCGEDCGKCLITIDSVKLPCSHTAQNIPCYKTQDLSQILCKVIVKKQVPNCHHKVDVRCGQDVTTDGFTCPTPCEIILPCGHLCPGTCGNCNSKDTNGQSTVKHQVCKKICGRRFGTCNHTCPRICHEGKDCGPCFSACEVQCAHSRCTLKCHEACTPCVESCAWSCEHRGDCTMPCSAPCNRLPCDERCSRQLPCGHQCPSICGEGCPAKYCHECGMKQDARVDMLEMKEYGEVDVNENPIVVLGCGHFFTAETLDGMIGMNDVYETDKVGAYTRLKEPAALAQQVPKCPDCNCPVRQYATQRYNRVINRAVIDEMSKRFLVHGQTRLQELELQVDQIGTTLEESRPNVTAIADRFSLWMGVGSKLPPFPRNILERYKDSNNLGRQIQKFLVEFSDRRQPTQKLYEATLRAIQKHSSLNNTFANLILNKASAVPDCDRRINLGGNMAQIKLISIALEDKYEITNKIQSSSGAKLPNLWPVKLTLLVLPVCEKFIASCIEESLPKLAVEGILHYAQITRLFATFKLLEKDERDQATEYRDKAKRLLEQGKELCKQPFQNADVLNQAVEESIKMLRGEWYEKVSPEELLAIKQAMVSGPRGIATHSGHWYNCTNGHPFAIGECGMPMEEARCPECGARIGGQGHIAVEGVTRAENMEH